MGRDQIYYRKHVRYRFLISRNQKYQIFCFFFPANVTSLNGNLLSPAGSSSSSNQSPPKPVTTPFQPQHQNNQHEESTNFGITESHVQQQIRFIDDEDSGNKFIPKIDSGQQLAINDEKLKLQSVALVQSQIMQPRNRLGFILPVGSPLVEENNNLDPETPVQTPIRSNQGSPFYAEPADALGNIIRRGQPIRNMPSNQRFSEPPKGPIKILPSSLISPVDFEKV